MLRNYYISTIKHIIYILLLLISFNGIAQEFADKEFYLLDSLVLEELSATDRQLIDSCLSIYHKAIDDTSKINSLNNICENMIHERWEDYQFYQYSLIQKTLKTNLKSSIKTRRSLMGSLASAYNNMGFIYHGKANTSKAMEYYYKSLKIFEKIGDQKGISTILNNLAKIYLEQEEITMALDYYNKSLKVRELIGDERGIAHCLSNISFIYHHNKSNTQEALKYSLKSINILEKIGEQNEVSYSYDNIGLIYRNVGKSTEALEYFHKSLEIHKRRGNKSGIAKSLHNIGSVYNRQGNIINALEHGKMSMDIATETGEPENILNSANLLHHIYEKQGKGMKALEMYKLYVQMKDSINNEETQKATIRQQTQYEFEKAQIVKENEAKEQARLEVEETSRRNNLQYSLIFLGILVLFVAILMLGFIKVSPNIAEGLIFFAFLILFEFVLVFTEPYMEQYTNGEPMYNLLANSVLALVIFPLHAILEKLLKKRIVK